MNTVLTTVNVTQGFIDNGDRTDCASCPVALAVNSALPEGVCAHVTVGIICFYDGPFSLGYVPTPEPAREFILAFDANERVSPFSFELEIPTEVGA